MHQAQRLTWSAWNKILLQKGSSIYLSTFLDFLNLVPKLVEYGWVKSRSRLGLLSSSQLRCSVTFCPWITHFFSNSFVAFRHPQHSLSIKSWTNQQIKLLSNYISFPPKRFCIRQNLRKTNYLKEQLQLPWSFCNWTNAGKFGRPNWSSEMFEIPIRIWGKQIYALLPHWNWLHWADRSARHGRSSSRSGCKLSVRLDSETI